MPTHQTSRNRDVDHQHRLQKEPDVSAADMAMLEQLMRQQFPQAELVGPPTIRYNCHGFALAPTHEGWFNFPDLFLSDDYIGVPMESPQLGDVLIYGRNGIITHSSVVVEVSGNTIVRLQSKWGRVHEVKHPVCHVPEIYGQPIVLLRFRPVLGPHPAISKFAAPPTPPPPIPPCPPPGAAPPTPAPPAAAPSGAAPPGAAPPAAAPEATSNMSAPDAEAGTAESSQKIPERLMLMFASSPEVERQIRHSNRFPERRRVDSADAPAPLDDAGPQAVVTIAASSATVTPSAEEEQQPEIQKALADFKSDRTQFQLMLASTPQVLREAASRLPPVKDLIELDKRNPATRRAIVKFFEKPEIHDDEELAGITLFTMTKLPTREGVPAIAAYLAKGGFSHFNGGLAVDALREAVNVATT